MVCVYLGRGWGECLERWQEVACMYCLYAQCLQSVVRPQLVSRQPGMSHMLSCIGVPCVSRLPNHLWCALLLMQVKAQEKTETAEEEEARLEAFARELEAKQQKQQQQQEQEAAAAAMGD